MQAGQDSTSGKSRRGRGEYQREDNDAESAHDEQGHAASATRSRISAELDERAGTPAGDNPYMAAG